MGDIIYSLDNMGWGTHDVDGVVSEIEDTRPLCIRLGNFYLPALEVLRRVSGQQLVFWRLEYMGEESRDCVLRSDEVVQPNDYAKEVMESGHKIVPYTYSAYNRDGLRRAVPRLKSAPIEILPIAQKTPELPDQDRGSVRKALAPSSTKSSIVFGAAGFYHDTKGIREIISRFAKSELSATSHLVCTVICPGRTLEETVRQWGFDVKILKESRIFFRLGVYGEWRWMCQFYGAIDVMLVNSASESWGRVVSEALGLYRPTIVKRARCMSNLLAPGTAVVDAIDFDSEDFRRALRYARDAAIDLGNYVNEQYSSGRVRGRFLDDLLIPNCTGGDRERLLELLGQPHARVRLDEALTY